MTAAAPASPAGTSWMLARTQPEQRGRGKSPSSWRIQIRDGTAAVAAAGAAIAARKARILTCLMASPRSLVATGVGAGVPRKARVIVDEVLVTADVVVRHAGELGDAGRVRDRRL